MSELLNKLAASEQIMRWIDPFDPILEKITGEEAPNGGALVREAWTEQDLSTHSLTRHIRRLLVPAHVALRGAFQVVQVPTRRSIRLNFSDEQDWHACFPTVRTEVTDQLGEPVTYIKTPAKRRWAAIGLTTERGALAVFSGQQKTQGAFALVEPVPLAIVDEIFVQLDT